jgi:uncharacterized protein YndB with AHSA1/START domain
MLMAKTKAKAKVKTVVKTKAKPAPKKAAANKSKTVKKAVSPEKKAASKAKPNPKKIVAKKTAVTKTVVKKAIVNKAIAKKTVVPNKGQAPKKAAPQKKIIAKAPVKVDKKKIAVMPALQKKSVAPAPTNKPVKKETIASLTKKPASLSKEVGGKSIKMDFPKKRAGRKPKNKGDEDDGFELLEVPKLEPINKKAPKKRFVIPVNPEIYVNPLAKPVPVPKNIGTYKKFEIEFPIHASPYIIYSFISTPAGLSEWFAENVNVRNDEYTFLWDGSQQTATLLSKKENTFMKFRWNDEPDFTFFEFRIVVDEITQDVAFWVTDFAEDEKSKEASEMLWHSQVDALIHAMGA